MVSESICCTECQRTESKTERKMQVFESEERLMCHIAMQHVFWIPFECILCPMMLMPTETVLKQHYEKTHPGEVPKAIYTFEERKKLELRRIFEESIVAHFHKGTPAENIPSCEQVVIHLDPSPQQGSKSRNEGRNEATDGVPTAVAQWNLQASSPSADIQNDASFDTSSAADSVTSGRQQSRRFNLNLSSSLQGKSSRERNNDHQASASSTETRETEIETSTPLPTIHQSDQVLDNKENILNNTADGRKSASVDAEDTVQTSARKIDDGRTKAVTPGRAYLAHQCLLCGQKLINKGMHVWTKHMSQKRYACQLCSYEATWRRPIAEHYKKEHADVGDWTDRTGELMKEYNTAVKFCFGARSKSADLLTSTALDAKENILNSTADIRKSPSIDEEDTAQTSAGKLDASRTKVYKVHQCLACGRKLMNNVAHIWTKHLSQKRYACQLCPYETTWGHSIAEHNKKEHADIGGWTDRTGELRKEYKTAMKFCFGARKESAGLLSATAMDDRENILNSTADIRKSPSINQEDTARHNQTTIGELDVIRTNVSKVHPCLPCGYKFSNKGLHIWEKHMSQKRYACQLCPYETTRGHSIAEHNKKEHADVGGWTDRTSELMKEYETAMKLCFDTRRKSVGLPTATAMDSTVTENDVCNLCKKPTPIRKKDHIWEEHMQTKRFGCNRCEYENNFSIGIKRHATKHHPDESADNEQQCMTYRGDVKRVADEYDRVYASAFGRQQKSKRSLRQKRGYSSVGSAATAPKIARREATTCRLCGCQVKNQALHIQRHHLGDNCGTGDSYDDTFQKAFG